MREVQVTALVDTAELMPCIPEHVSVRLNLQEFEKREVTTADGKRRLVPHVGPVKVRFQNRSCFVGVLVFGYEVLLGAVSMEDMDLVVSPGRRAVSVNSDNSSVGHFQRIPNQRGGVKEGMVAGGRGANVVQMRAAHQHSASS